MRRALLLAAAAACTPTAAPPLPGASVTASSASARAPSAASPRVSARACGDDVAFDDSGAPAARYRYTYDDRGRLARSAGTYAAGGDDVIVYAYDFVDHVTSVAETSGGAPLLDVAADYDTLEDLVTYRTDQIQGSGHAVTAYAFADFTPGGQPATEVITSPGQPDARLHLAYDPAGRVQLVVADGGGTTTYTYDDAARTTTIDTAQGAYHGVIAFDEVNREVAETWGGTAADAIASEQTFTYDGDRLVAMAYRSGTPAAPRSETVIELDTILYDCSP